MKHVIAFLADLEDMIVNGDENNWPAPTKIAWRLRMAVDRDINEKNSPSSFFRERLSQIQYAVNMQTEDGDLWESPINLREEYLQKALKDLHRVIENDEPEDALTMIRGRLDT